MHRPPRRLVLRGPVRRRLLIGAASVTAAAVQDPLHLVDLPAGPLVWRILRWPAVVLALLAWAGLILRTTRARRGRRRPVLVGAAVTTGGWVAASTLFPLCVAIVGRLSTGLGWLWGRSDPSGVAVPADDSLYLGAEVTCVLAGHRLRSRRGPDPE